MARKSSSGPNYSSYEKAYDKKRKQLAKKGLTMADTKFTKTEFEFAYKLERQQMVKLVKEGKRKVVGNITQNLVSEQAYEKSLSQARTLKAAYEEIGIKVSIQGIRENTAKAQEASLSLSDVYHGYIDSGLTSQEASTLISKVYFGS